MDLLSHRRAADRHSQPQGRQSGRLVVYCRCRWDGSFFAGAAVAAGGGRGGFGRERSGIGGGGEGGEWPSAGPRSAAVRQQQELFAACRRAARLGPARRGGCPAGEARRPAISPGLSGVVSGY